MILVVICCKLVQAVGGDMVVLCWPIDLQHAIVSSEVVTVVSFTACWLNAGRYVILGSSTT